MRILLMGDEVQVPNTAGAGTSFSEATCVRLVNPSSSTDYDVTVQETADGTTVGSFKILRLTSEFLEKKASHTVYVSSGTDVRGAKVGLTG